MTTYASESIQCGSCGHVFGFHALQSTNTFGHSDLDTRPPEMKRLTMEAWIQRCPACGYCSRDATKFDEKFRPVMDSAAYRSQLADAHYPSLASTFICAALLSEVEGNSVETGWNYLHAAWVLDDAQKDELARVWRGKAADILLALLYARRPFIQQPGASEAILVDCLRRAGRGEEALDIIEKALSQSFDEIIHKVLVLEQALIRRKDTARHLVSEALGGQ